MLQWFIVLRKPQCLEIWSIVSTAAYNLSKMVVLIKCKPHKYMSIEIDTTNTPIYDRALFWLGTDTSIKSCRVKLALSLIDLFLFIDKYFSYNRDNMCTNNNSWFMWKDGTREGGGIWKDDLFTTRKPQCLEIWSIFSTAAYNTSKMGVRIKYKPHKYMLCVWRLLHSVFITMKFLHAINRVVKRR
jgi:hypothetical protein